MIGQHIYINSQNFALFGGCDGSCHVVVASETRGNQILVAIFHPLNWLTGDDRADNRKHVTGIDRHLIAEPTTDIWADNPDFLLWEPSYHRVHRAVRMWCLCCRIHGQLTGNFVKI